jgi:ribosomal protein S12
MLLHFAAEGRKAKYAEYAYPRACNPDNCRNCQYAGICLDRIHVDAKNPPEGFRIALHEELSNGRAV